MGGFMMKRLTLAMMLLLMTVIIGCSSAKSLEFAGVVETSVVSHYSQVAGKIIELPIELGQEIKAGDVIAIIDDSNEKYTLEQLQAVLAKKQALMTELLEGIEADTIQTENNILLAQKALESAELTSELAHNSFEKAQSLYEAGGISEVDRDEAEYRAQQAAIDITVKETQLDNARQKLITLQKDFTQAKINSLQAEIDQTASQIKQVEENLAKFKITAICEGTIISKNYLLGNMVSPGFNITDIASETDKYLVTYLPEEYLPIVSYEQEVVIKAHEEEYRGTVAFIDAKAQYTPKDMQTAANKNKDSVKLKIKLGDHTPLKVGEKAVLFLEKQP